MSAALIKAEILEIMIKIANSLDSQNLLYLSDSLTSCMESVATKKIKENKVAIRVSSIATFLDKKGEIELAEQLDNILTDIISLEDGDYYNTKTMKSKNRAPADKVYKIAITYRQSYQQGHVDEKSFEYGKMKELESILKAGFLLPPPTSYRSLPNDSNNWWEHFQIKNCADSPPKKYKDTGATKKSDYADPSNYKYPIHTEKNVRAALSYFSKSKNYNEYSKTNRSKIWNKIKAAAKKYKIELNKDNDPPWGN